MQAVQAAEGMQVRLLLEGEQKSTFLLLVANFLFQLHQLFSLGSVSAMKAGQVGETLILN